MGSEGYAIVGGSLNGECICSLEAMGYEVIVLPEDGRLGRYVCTHTDLSVFPLGDKLFVYDSGAGELLDSKGLRTVVVGEVPRGEYPYDIHLNALAVGEYIFAREPYLSEAIKLEARATGRSVVDVKQGYARCSACPIADNAIITADTSIAVAAERLGIDVLRVSPGVVMLEGFDHGFIGGACGVSDHRVVFAGDIYTHADGARIVEFCQRHGKEVVSLCGGALYDVGSIFFVGGNYLLAKNKHDF